MAYLSAKWLDTKLTTVFNKEPGVSITHYVTRLSTIRYHNYQHQRNDRFERTLTYSKSKVQE